MSTDFQASTPHEQTDEVSIRRDGRAGRITLNRPKALNALTGAMIKSITAALNHWTTDPTVEVIILDGAGDRGLCAGGDVRWLYETRTQGPAQANGFWREEYILNAMISRYSKPFVAIMDGIVMGGGIGLSAHARHRIVTERSSLAMPETAIGLVPDVGGTFLLGRAQGRLGLYLGLTGARMDGSDAIQAGFADAFISTGKLSDILAQLSTSNEPVDEIIEQASEPVPMSTLAARRELIDRLFAGDNVEAVTAALLTTTDPLAQKAHIELTTRSPKALVLTFHAIHRARILRTLEEALTVEYRLVTRLFADGEFIEGVRALIVDKDKTPRWTPTLVKDVTSAMVDGFFAPLPPGEELTW